MGEVVGAIISSRRHLCHVCKKYFFWANDSRWFGSLRDEDDSRGILKFCTDSCRQLFEQQNPRPDEVLKQFQKTLKEQRGHD